MTVYFIKPNTLGNTFNPEAKAPFNVLRQDSPNQSTVVCHTEHKDAAAAIVWALTNPAKLVITLEDAGVKL